MASIPSDNSSASPDVQTTLQDLQTQLDNLTSNQTSNAAPTTAIPNTPTNTPQGQGSHLDADTVDGIEATTVPMPHCLLPLDATAEFPISVIPATAHIVAADNLSGGIASEIPYQTAPNTTAFIVNGTSGQYLTSNGTSAPSWTTFPITFGTTTATDKNILMADGTDWESVAISGDLTVTADTGTFTFNTVNSNTGTFGTASQVGSFTVNGKGLITAASNIDIFIDPIQIADATGGAFSFTTYSTAGLTPQSIAFDGTNMWVACGSAGVTKVDPSGNFTTYNGGNFTGAVAIAFDGTYMWVSDNTNSKLFKVDSSGNITLKVASFAPYSAPVRLVYDGTYLWGSDSGYGVYQITTAAYVSRYNISDTSAQFYGLTFDGNNVWVVDAENTKIYKFASGGAYTGYSISGFQPLGVIFDGTYLWTANAGDHSSTKVNLSGTSLANYTGLPSGGNDPLDVAFDGTNLWFVSPNADSVSVMTQTGTVTNHSIGAGMKPHALAWNSVTSSMWIADSGNSSATKATNGVGAILGIVDAQIDPNAAIKVSKLAAGTNNYFIKTLTGTPTWALLLSGDIPNNAANTTGTASNITASSNTSLTSLVNLATIGTIGTGTWNGTKINLAYGGTNADLSATGGTSNVLKQVSSGAAITVGQLAFTDISGTLGVTKGGQDRLLIPMDNF